LKLQLLEEGKKDTQPALGKDLDLQLLEERKKDTQPALGKDLKLQLLEERKKDTQPALGKVNYVALSGTMNLAAAVKGVGAERGNLPPPNQPISLRILEYLI
jgi:hypothetical protein